MENNKFMKNQKIQITVKNQKFSVLIEKDADGFFAKCEELQGCYTQGETFDEAVENIKEALHLHLEDRENSNV